MAARLSSAFGFGKQAFMSSEDRQTVRDLEADLALLEEKLFTDLRMADPVVDAVARYLMEAGGKRVRPTLLLLAAKLGGGTNDEVLTAAEVVEITHLASLYHDDVMDDAVLRRGVPAAQEVWNNSIAILAGDLLFARAASLLAPLGQEVAQLQAQTFERLCLGQMHETLGAGDVDPTQHYIQVLADKTGSLIACAAELGVVVSGAEDRYRKPMREFGESIGIAFQLIDDILDLSSDPGTGKPAGTDMRAGVTTLPLLYLRGYQDEASLTLLHALESETDDERFAAAVAELAAHEATARTRAEAVRWQQLALAAIQELPTGSVRRGLEAFAESVINRAS